MTLAGTSRVVVWCVCFRVGCFHGRLQSTKADVLWRRSQFSVRLELLIIFVRVRIMSCQLFGEGAVYVSVPGPWCGSVISSCFLSVYWSVYHFPVVGYSGKICEVKRTAEVLRPSQKFEPSPFWNCWSFGINYGVDVTFTHPLMCCLRPVCVFVSSHCIKK